IPSEILNKPGKLTDKEFNLIKSHSSLGYTALKDISIMPELAVGACAHHERPDGNGYPKGWTTPASPGSHRLSPWRTHLTRCIQTALTARG
ncbi:MAG: hypothetical protein II837_00550, partial [Treponema sp.]|nr:hypothetical protein [Treponema sp.]